MDLNEMPEGSFNAADMGADDAAYAPHKEGEEKDLTPDGGVKKLLVKAGEGWDKPETGDEVHGEICLISRQMLSAQLATRSLKFSICLFVESLHAACCTS